MIKDILANAEKRMDKAVEAMENDLMAIRTGRASPSLVERLTVDYYNMPTPLQQLAAISIPDAQTIQIRPYTANDIPAIERAIALSDLGLTPNNDGQNIRLIIPPLTEERRRDLSKVVHKRAEEARVAVRNIRRDEINDLREMERESMISEDDLHRGQDRIQDKTDEHIKHIDDLAKEKEKEIMTL
ncbi:MAG: ribosome recycling factor [Caldilineaceae bacterium]|nr:ribosome recycling factor [Caldilineaceae bacterium]MCB9139531.1 ribosome recycling factor [Caldilineaceae bacterium]